MQRGALVSNLYALGLFHLAPTDSFGFTQVRLTERPPSAGGAVLSTGSVASADNWIIEADSNALAELTAFIRRSELSGLSTLKPGHFRAGRKLTHA